MSTLQNNQGLWSSISSETLNSKHEKCRNIAEEIYKRINITFQIKKLEAGPQSELSDHSDLIDSNELSNETDLFACDKSSISSSTELEALEKGSEACEKYINNNNNEETKIKTPIVCKRPKKRFRKRVKKQQKQKTKPDSDCSSDEAPLSHVADLDNLGRSDRTPPSPSHTVMGVPYVVIRPCDLKLKFKSPSPEKKVTKKSDVKLSTKIEDIPKETRDKKEGKTTAKKDQKTTDKTYLSELSMKDKNLETKNCTMCSLSFRGERGLRRHMTMSHIMESEDMKKSSKTVQ